MRLIDRIAAEHDLAIETVPHDLHEPVPEEYGEAFDVFYTDPCSNEACLTLFLSRGIGCLREGGAGHVAVMHPAETLYRRLTEQMGFPVTGFQHDFNHYYWASMRLAYYISDEYSHRKTSDTTPARLLCESFETAEELFDDFLTPDSHPYAVDFTEIDAARADAEDVASLLGRALDLAGETIHDTGELLTYSANRVRGGYINLLIDRPRRFMKLTLMPLDLSEERRARHALVEHFGGKALTNRTSSGPEIEQF